jgi:hypothetical protein
MAELVTIPTPTYEYQPLDRDAIAFESETNRMLSPYFLAQPDQIVAYVREHSALPALLHEAAPKLKESFGSDTILKLELGTDGDEGSVLRLLAMWPGSLASANAALKNFDESFWIANCDRASGGLVIDRELV